MLQEIRRSFPQSLVNSKKYEKKKKTISESRRPVLGCVISNMSPGWWINRQAGGREDVGSLAIDFGYRAGGARSVFMSFHFIFGMN